MNNFFLLLAANLIEQEWNQNVFSEKSSTPLMLPYDECKAMDIVDLLYFNCPSMIVKQLFAVVIVLGSMLILSTIFYLFFL